MKALVTGGAGFIGSHLTDSLLERGWEVVSVDDLSKGRREVIEHNIGRDGYEFVEMDCRDQDRLAELGEGANVVVHLAATKIPRDGNRLGNVITNLEGGRSALEAARANDSRYVLASTSDVYGNRPDLPFTEGGITVSGPSTVARWAYGIGKLADEHMAWGYNEEYGLEVAVLRFFGSYGERQYLNWWGGPQGVFLRAISGGEPMTVHGDGSQTRCFTHIDDMTEATARAVERPEVNGEIINIGNDEEISILGLAELMHRLSGLGGEPKIEFIPYDKVAAGAYQDVHKRVPDLTKQREILGFTPEVSLEEGLRRLWDWYVELDRRDESVPA
jgi:UDP-glucose 4-epimerase